MREFKPFCSPHGSARGSLVKEKLSPVVAGRRATILQPPSIIAGLPSAVAWSHPTAEGVSSTIAQLHRHRRHAARRPERPLEIAKASISRPTSAPANGAMSSVFRWRGEAVKVI